MVAVVEVEVEPVTVEQVPVGDGEGQRWSRCRWVMERGRGGASDVGWVMVGDGEGAEVEPVMVGDGEGQRWRQ